MFANLMEYFNKQPRIGTLSTSGKDGKVDVAVFGSPHMIDEKTVLLETVRRETAKFVSEEAAKMMYAAVTLEVVEIRPIIDFGQGWEKSI